MTALPDAEAARAPAMSAAPTEATRVAAVPMAATDAATTVRTDTVPAAAATVTDHTVSDHTVAAHRGGSNLTPEGLPASAAGETRHLPFTLLLPVYRGDDAAFLRRAFDSATAEQTRRPDEAVVVQDGPVGPDLQAELASIEQRSCVPVTIIRLEQNVGLARALSAGLLACRYDVVARADADDVSLPHRFEVQLPLVEAGADLVGSSLVEFDGDEHVVGTARLMPTEPDEIARYARFADPFNHPTVVYRRQAVAAVGGYQDLHLMEDYLLFARMIADGAAVRNVAEPLVKYRVGAGAYRRRGGRRLLRAELSLQRILHREAFTTRGQYLRNVLVRGGYRLVPVALRRWAYRSLLLTRRLPGVRHQ
jgi:glycosyltransferase involved in cell wall biosynthesis